MAVYIRNKTRARLGGRCHYCRAPFSDRVDSDYYPTREHRHPRAKGGRGGRNIVWACRRCNNEKGDMTEQEYDEFLRVVCHIPSDHRVKRLRIWRKWCDLKALDAGKNLLQSPDKTSG